MTRLSRWLAFASVAAMLVVWFLIAGIGDRIWWTLPLVYGPHWLAGGLFVGLLPALLFARRAALAAALVMSLVFVFGVLDFRLPFGRMESGKDYSVRVLEMNTGGGRSEQKVPAAMQEIARLAPDIVIVAECSRGLAQQIGAQPGWQVETTASRQCFASRLPVLDWQIRNPRDFWEMNGSGGIARAVVNTPAGPLRVGLVHLETPREALQEFMDLSSIPSLGEVTRKNIAQRELESSVAREWIFDGDLLPTIVAGDFNLPVQSAIYRRHWSDLRNAFSRAGFGFGSTKRTRLWGSRIDHILASEEFAIVNVGIGNDIASDHRPIYADLSIATAAAVTRAAE